MTYKNSYCEEFTVNSSEFNILTIDNKNFDRIINPFDLNLSKNFPYDDEDKNNSCFLEIETEFENILVVFKTNELLSLEEMLYPYFNYDTYSYDVNFTNFAFNLINNKNQLVLMYGTSIIILDIDTFEVLNYCSSDNIKNYGINIFYKNNIYIVEDIFHNFTFFDEDLNVLSEDNEIVKKYINKTDN